MAYEGTKEDLLKEIQRWLADALSRNQIVHPIDRSRGHAFVADIFEVLDKKETK